MRKETITDEIIKKDENEKQGIAFERRDFLKLMGGGIFVLFNFGDVFAQQRTERSGSEYPTDFNAYLRIGEDGRVTCFSGKVELGQGAMTSLAQILAEELDVPLDRVDMIMGDTALCPYDMGTFGSRSTKYFGPALRQAGAEARAVLLQLAAEYLKTSPEQLTAKDGVIYMKNNPTQQVSYGDLTKGKKIERHLSEKVSVKAVAQHTLCGKPADRLDGKPKVTGEAKFAGDIRLPGMLYAKLLRPPVHGAVLKSVDTSAAEEIPGVQVVRDKDFIAVLHQYPDKAEEALRKIKAQFDLPERKVNNENIFLHLLASPPAPETVSEAGDLEKGKMSASKKIAAKYFTHYVAHAAIEPHAATAKIEGDTIVAWVSTQAPFRDKPEVARSLGMPEEKVRILPAFVGGGFGGKTRNLQAVEAAKLAKLTGKPVQVAWTREEEFFFDTFRPAAVVDINAGVNNDGRIGFWDYRVYFAGTRSSQPIYNIPHCRVSAHGQWGGSGAPSAHPFSVGAWRGPGSNTNVFAVESHIDLLAEAAGLDPLSFRLKNITDERMKRVIEAAAEKFGHTFAKSPSGQGYGIACTDYLGTYVALMAEVKVNERTGDVRVERVVCAQDTGEMINPEGIRIQIEGCIIMGLGYLFTEEIHFNGGDIRDRNFDTYEISRFSWIPKIETVLIDNPGLAPQGCGEPAITGMGALIANAVYDAIGARCFMLPMTPQRIKEQISLKTSK